MREKRNEREQRPSFGLWSQRPDWHFFRSSVPPFSGIVSRKLHRTQGSACNIPRDARERMTAERGQALRRLFCRQERIIFSRRNKPSTTDFVTSFNIALSNERGSWFCAIICSCLHLPCGPKIFRNPGYPRMIRIVSTLQMLATSLPCSLNGVRLDST